MDYNTWKQAALELWPHLAAIAEIERRYQVDVSLIVRRDEPCSIYAYTLDPVTGAHYSLDVKADNGLGILLREDGTMRWETIKGVDG